MKINVKGYSAITVYERSDAYMFSTYISDMFYKGALARDPDNPLDLSKIEEEKVSIAVRGNNYILCLPMEFAGEPLEIRLKLESKVIQLQLERERDYSDYLERKCKEYSYFFNIMRLDVMQNPPMQMDITVACFYEKHEDGSTGFIPCIYKNNLLDLRIIRNCGLNANLLFFNENTNILREKYIELEHFETGLKVLELYRILNVVLKIYEFPVITGIEYCNYMNYGNDRFIYLRIDKTRRGALFNPDKGNTVSKIDFRIYNFKNEIVTIMPKILYC